MQCVKEIALMVLVYIPMSVRNYWSSDQPPVIIKLSGIWIRNCL